MNRINSFLHLPFQLHTCLHSSCFMSNDIQLLLLGCESTRCHMDIILRRLCIKENVQIEKNDLTTCKQDVTSSQIRIYRSFFAWYLAIARCVCGPVQKWSVASFAAPHPICVFVFLSMVKLQGQTLPWGTPRIEKFRSQFEGDVFV